MEQYAKINNGIVENIIVSKTHPEPNEEYININQNIRGVEIGYSYDSASGFQPFKGDAITIDELNEATPGTEEFTLRFEAAKRKWRDQELKNTDWVVAAVDHPQLEAYKTYRQALRDWPSTDDFPNTIPEL